MQNTNENFSFKKYAWNQFKKNKIALMSLYLLFVLIIIAVFAILESVVGFCAGCFVFSQLMKIGIIPESTCEKCNNINL